MANADPQSNGRGIQAQNGGRDFMVHNNEPAVKGNSVSFPTQKPSASAPAPLPAPSDQASQTPPKQ